VKDNDSWINIESSGGKRINPVSWANYIDWANFTYWDDLKAPLYSTKVRSGSKAPTFKAFIAEAGSSLGLYAYAFSIGNYVDLSFQVPHSYKVETDIRAHIHIFTTSTGGGSSGQYCRFNLSYIWMNINGTVPTSTINVSTNDAIITKGTHQLLEFGNLSGTSKDISSILVVSCERVSITGVGHVEYIGDLFVSDLDLHFQSDAPGSHDELVKQPTPSYP
jgi:hypothetical protein